MKFTVNEILGYDYQKVTESTEPIYLPIKDIKPRDIDSASLISLIQLNPNSPFIFDYKETPVEDFIKYIDYDDLLIDAFWTNIKYSLLYLPFSNTKFTNNTGLITINTLKIKPKKGNCRTADVSPSKNKGCGRDSATNESVKKSLKDYDYLNLVDLNKKSFKDFKIKQLFIPTKILIDNL